MLVVSWLSDKFQNRKLFIWPLLLIAARRHSQSSKTETLRDENPAQYPLFFFDYS
jgi:hypothetical protein